MTLDARPDAPLDAALDGGPASGSRAASDERWLAVCRVGDLAPERGAAALVDGVQVAVFRLADDSVYAVDQLDPFSGAYVMARGIVGSRGEAPTVASPMYKQVFDLRTGRCLEAVGREPVDLAPWPVQVVDGMIFVDRSQARGAHGAHAGHGSDDVAGAA